MDDADGGLSFDFEGGLEAVAAHINVGLGGASGLAPSLASLPAGAGQQGAAAPAPGGLLSGSSKAAQGRKNYRQTVCRHWLRGLCMKGDACGFLHQYDKSRMPVCRFFAKFGECREPDCIYKHTNEDIKECNMYKLGFCPNGPDCRYRHQKIQGSAPSIETVVQKLQLRVYAVNGGHHGRQQKQNQSHGGHGDGPPWQQPGGPGTLVPSERAEDSQNHVQLQKGQPQSDQPQGVPVQQTQAGAQHQAGNGPLAAPKMESLSSPLPQGYSRFFIVKSSNRENLNLSVERGLWATHRNNESKLNEAYDSCDNVLLIFSVNETRHFQGCAQMVSKIGGIVGGGGWKYAHGTAHYGRNFRLKWLKLCELSFNKTRHLRNSYNDNLPVKISRDCQELEPLVGDQLASLLYLEPDSELMALAKNFEKKAEEDKLSGGPAANEEMEDPNIVPFEDNEDGQEENDSDDEDVSSLAVGPGHGRGRPPMRGNQMWPPNGPGLDVIDRGRNMGGPRPMGFRPHPEIGVDGFRMNWMGMGDGPGMPPADMFGGPARPFHGPENGGPGFGPMDGVGPMPGPVYFPGRPHPSGGMFPPGGPKMMGPPPRMGPPPGLVMNPGPGGSYYMHGMNGPMMRPNRPMGMPFPPPYPGGGPGGGGKNRGPRNPDDIRPLKKPKLGDRSIASGKNSSSGMQRRGSESSDQGEFYGQDSGDPLAHGSKGYLDDEDSESEDEAPRRSRHGEGKKRRRDWEEWEIGAPAWDQAGGTEIRVAAE